MNITFLLWTVDQTIIYNTMNRNYHNFQLIDFCIKEQQNSLKL